MTIHRNRPAGSYATADTVAAAEFEHFDKYLSEAIHGKGGVYSLTTELVIGGDDVTITEALTVGGNLDVANDVTIGDDLDVAGNVGVDGGLAVTLDLIVGDDASIAGNVDVTGSITITTDLIVGDGAEITGDLHVVGSSSFEDVVEFNGAVTFQADTTFNDLATFTDTLNADGNCFLGSDTGFVETLGVVTHRKRVTFADDGKLCARQQVASSDADFTVLGARVDTVFVPTGLFTASRTVTIDDTGATDGMRIKFHCEDTTNPLLIRPPVGTPIATAGGTGDVVAWVERVNGVWYGS